MLDKWRLLVSSSLIRAPSHGQEVWFHGQQGKLVVACEVAVVATVVPAVGCAPLSLFVGYGMAWYSPKTLVWSEESEVAAPSGLLLT